MGVEPKVTLGPVEVGYMMGAKSLPSPLWAIRFPKGIGTQATPVKRLTVAPVSVPPIMLLQSALAFERQKIGKRTIIL